MSEFVTIENALKRLAAIGLASGTSARQEAHRAEQALSRIRAENQRLRDEVREHCEVHQQEREALKAEIADLVEQR